MSDATQPKPLLKFPFNCPKLNSAVEIDTSDWSKREDPPGFDWRGVCPKCGEEHFGFAPRS